MPPLSHLALSPEGLAFDPSTGACYRLLAPGIEYWFYTTVPTTLQGARQRQRAPTTRGTLRPSQPWRPQTARHETHPG